MTNQIEATSLHSKDKRCYLLSQLSDKKMFLSKIYNDVYNPHSLKKHSE